MNKYKIILLMGAAGSGKDYLLNELQKTIQEDDELKNKINFVKTCSTRPSREEEKNIYYKIKESEFKELIDNNSFIEYDYYNNSYYGTLYNELKPNKVNIKAMTPNGILKLLENENFDIRIFFLELSDKERLIRQIEREKNPNINEKIFERFKADKENFAFNKIKNISFVLLNSSKDIPIHRNVDILLQTIKELLS